MESVVCVVREGDKFTPVLMNELRHCNLQECYKVMGALSALMLSVNDFAAKLPPE
jgi:hypothetical protein